jgi:hypothetical protein
VKAAEGLRVQERTQLLDFLLCQQQVHGAEQVPQEEDRKDTAWVETQGVLVWQTVLDHGRNLLMQQ